MQEVDTCNNTIKLTISMLLKSTYYRTAFGLNSWAAKLIYADRKQVSGRLGPGVGKGNWIDFRGAQGNFWGDGNVP